MGNTNEELVRKGYDAFSAGDMDTLRSIMKPDIVQHVPGDNQVAGTFEGVDAVLASYAETFELSGGTFSVDLQSVDAVGDNRVDSVHKGTATRGDKTYAGTTTLGFTIEDGLIARIDEKPHDQAVEDVFWG